MCDAASSEELAAAAALGQRGGSGAPVGPPFGILLHAGGVLADAALANQSLAGSRAVVAPKISALQLLRRCVLALGPTAHSMLFSSVAALLGSAGQTNYSYANAALDAAARELVAAGLPAVSVQFSAWAGAGMASATVAGHWRPDARGWPDSPAGRTGCAAQWVQGAPRAGSIALQLGQAAGQPPAGAAPAVRVLSSCPSSRRRRSRGACRRTWRAARPDGGAAAKPAAAAGGSCSEQCAWRGRGCGRAPHVGRPGLPGGCGAQVPSCCIRCRCPCQAWSVVGTPAVPPARVWCTSADRRHGRPMTRHVHATKTGWREPAPPSSARHGHATRLLPARSDVLQRRKLHRRQGTLWACPVHLRLF